MNKLLTNTQASSSVRHAARNYIFKLNDSEAFDFYKQEMESAKKQGQKGSLGINYFGIGGDADFVNSFAPPAQVPPVRDKDIPVRTTPPPPPVTGSDCTFGKFTCKAGFVWRQTRPADVVCVTPAARHRAALENATAGSHQRRIHIKGHVRVFCTSSFVRREAYEGDTVCVSAIAKRLTAQDNAAAFNRIACMQ